MEVILTEDQNSELKTQENRALEVKQPVLEPGEALNLVFGEYAANTQRAYARPSGIYSNGQISGSCRNWKTLIHCVCWNTRIS